MLTIPQAARPLLPLIVDLPRRTPLTLRELVILHMIEANPGHSVRHFSATLRLHKPAVTRAIDALSERGLARRVKDSMDKRQIMVTITPAGAALLAECRSHA